MSADAFVAQWARPARVRSGANDLAIGLPLVIAAAAIGWRWHGAVAALGIVLAGLGLIAGFAVWRARRFDGRWLVGALDAGRADMEDSADLLLAAETGLGPLQRLQRTRLLARLADDAAAALRPGWNRRAIAAAWLGGALIVMATLLWPARDRRGPAAPGSAAVVASGPTRLVAQRLRIVPPGYTGLPARTVAGLGARAPQGSRLGWTLRFAPQPARVDLVLIDGRRLALTRSGEDWVLARTLNRSILYRVEAVGAKAPSALNRIDAVPDLPPTVRVLAPERTLTLLTPGQRRWTLGFQVGDDHGVAAVARLRLIVTQGEGENITFRESALVLRGVGPARRRRFTTSLDIAALGLTTGNDLVAQLIVADNRAPLAQTVRSPSLILRWPPDLGTQGAGLDGMVKTVLPAYFRSQRQIIIDAEALQRARPGLAATRFADRSDALGEDQRILRLRYGQFLGEESSEAPTLPTNDAPAAETPAKTAEAPALPTGHAADDGHDHGAAAPPVFGNAGSVLADYGHAHGDDDSATLIDPGTRATLRQALDAMWDSERNLRQGAPEKALPFAYIALRLIKQVQQATRIYLARTGPELPPIDLGRRLGGDRKGLGNPQLVPSPRTDDGTGAVPAAAWAALGGPGPVRLDGLQSWLADSATSVADPLAMAAAIDAVQRDPGCAACRRTLRGLLWQAIPTPPAQVPRRAGGDAVGRRYLDALR